MPSQPILREIKSPLARELAEYQLLMKDLEAAHATLNLWFDRYAGRVEKHTTEERLIAQSLFRDSIVMFVGCFDKTAPLRLSIADVYKTADQAKYFQWLLDIRDSYAAHKFGALRQCVVGVVISDTGEIIQAGHTDQIWAGPKFGAKDDLLSFIKIAGRYVHKKIVALSNQLIASAKMMSPAELAALKPAKTYRMEPHEIRTSRQRLPRVES